MQIIINVLLVGTTEMSHEMSTGSMEKKAPLGGQIMKVVV